MPHPGHDELYIGSAPAAEDCAQLGSDGYGTEPAASAES